MGKGDLLLCIAAFWGADSLLTVVKKWGKKPNFLLRSVQVCLQFSSLCSVLEREGCGSDSQEQGKTQVSAGTMVILCDLRCECRLLPCPPTDLVSCRHRLWDSGCPLFWTREMHR